MSIAKLNYEGLGARQYVPSVIGTSGQTPLPEWAFGTVVGGDCESEFVYLWFAPTANITLNQGDWVAWDNSYGVAGALLGATVHPVGSSFGTIYYGGRVGDPAAYGQGNVWSFAFVSGTVYGIWVQRAGTSISNLIITNANKQVSTTATANNLTQLTTAAANSVTVSGVGAPPATFSLASTVTVSGSSTITLAAGTDKTKGLYKGLYLSGTGVPNGSYIVDIQGLAITMNTAATASGTVTVTAAANTFWGTITNGSPTITGVPSIPGVYPNQTLAGTGTTGTIASITGVPGNYTITMSANAGAGNAFASACTVSGYLETFLRWPYAQTQN